MEDPGLVEVAGVAGACDGQQPRVGDRLQHRGCLGPHAIELSVDYQGRYPRHLGERLGRVGIGLARRDRHVAGEDVLLCVFFWGGAKGGW